MKRTIEPKLITDAVRDLFIDVNTNLRRDILSALKKAREKEDTENGKYVLDVIIENSYIAREKELPICQDTGMAVVYLKIGQSVIIKGDIKNSVEKGIKLAYKQGCFRKSVVSDPLVRKNTQTNLPAIIYIDIVPGNKINIRAAVKGFGCENVSRIKMFRPTDSYKDIEKFVVSSVKEAGSRPCPPVYIGIGIGATLDKAVFLSREAIFRPVGEYNKKPHLARLEKNILREVNKLNIGPGGVGGRTTALGVSALSYPTHIAGLPVAVYISCHATRTAEKTI